jgi:hypothetical protein
VYCSTIAGRLLYCLQLIACYGLLNGLQTEFIIFVWQDIAKLINKYSGYAVMVQFFNREEKGGDGGEGCDSRKKLILII